MKRSWIKRTIVVGLLALLLAVPVLLRAGRIDAFEQQKPGLIQQWMNKWTQKRMERLIEFLDSPGYVETVSWNEHVVLSYMLAQVRAPSPLEFFLLRKLHEGIGMRRSTVLSVALRGESPYATWAQCRGFVRRVRISDFRVDPEVRRIARELASVPISEIIESINQMAEAGGMEYLPEQLPAEPPVPHVQYDTYFGYLHAHSELSDGEGDPVEAYAFAHEEGGLDFFALTDHGEFLRIWPWENKWEELVDAAEALYDPGTYVTLWGFEWSNPFLGHINVINTSDFTDTITLFSIRRLYDWITDRPEGFGRYNHPGDYDFLNREFLHMELYPDVAPQMVGMELWNGNDSFDMYYYAGGWFSDDSYWDEGNLQGWYLGAFGAQDNHSPNWGTRNDFRTAVLAEDLTRENIIDAYRNRRFYTTEDKDLFLDLRCQGYPMGARLSGVQRVFTVEAWDESEDSFEEVRLYRNGDLLETRVVSGESILEEFTDPFRTGSDYYYVIVRQTDDNDGNGRHDEAISSPIWID